MIRQLRGTVIQAGANQFIIDCGGVGYGVFSTPATAAGLRLDESTVIHTSMVVREDSQTLYGFSTQQERDAFELVQVASGVGPKLAIAIISVLPVGDLKRAIQTEDLARLCTVPGVGRKSAQRLVIELKDKVALLPDDDTTSGASPQPGAGWEEQVSEGLQSLGWSARDAARAVENISGQVDEDASIAVLMRAALGTLAKR